MVATHLVLTVLVPTIWIVDAANGTRDELHGPSAGGGGCRDWRHDHRASGRLFRVQRGGKALTIRGAGTSWTFGAGLPSPPGSPSEQSLIDAVPAGAVFYLSGMVFAAPPPTLPAAFGAPARRGFVDRGAPRGRRHRRWGHDRPLSPRRRHGAREPLLDGRRHRRRGRGAASDSKLAAEASVFAGGAGNPAVFNSNGGAGVAVQSGAATLARSSAFGGSALAFGGHGIIVGPASVLRVAGTSADVIQGGATASTLAGRAISVDNAGSAIVHGNVTLIAGGPGSLVTACAGHDGAVPLPYLATRAARPRQASSSRLSR